MPRTKYPRLQALTRLGTTGTTITGFGGGLAAGLAQTIPYGMSYFPERQQAIMSQLQELAKMQLDHISRLYEQQVKTMAELNIKEMQEFGDIIQKNIFVRPTTPDRANVFLKSITNMDYEIVPINEVVASLRTRKFDPEVQAIPTAALNPIVSQQVGMMKVTSSNLSDLLRALKLKADLINDIADIVRKQFNDTIFTPMAQYQYILQSTQALAELGKTTEAVNLLLKMLGIPATITETGEVKKEAIKIRGTVGK